MEYPIIEYKISKEQLESGEISLTPFSLVEEPAIEINMIQFKKDLINFKFSNELKKEIIGPLMIPNLPIYRSVPYPHYCVFSEESIEAWFEFNMQNSLFNNISFQHNGKIIDGLFVKEAWLTGVNDKSKDYGYDLPKGTPMAHIKCSDEAWSMINELGLKGLSVELNGDAIDAAFANQCSITSDMVTISKLRKAVMEEELDSIKLSADFALEYWNKPCRCSNCRELKSMGYTLKGTLPELDQYKKQHKIS